MYFGFKESSHQFANELENDKNGLQYIPSRRSCLGAYYGSYIQTYFSTARDQWHHTLSPLVPFIKTLHVPGGPTSSSIARTLKIGHSNTFYDVEGRETCDSTSGMLLCKHNSIGIYQMAISICWSSFTRFICASLPLITLCKKMKIFYYS